MNCNKCKKWIHLYLDGALGPDQEDLFFSHIENCPECASYYEDMVWMLRRMPEEEAGLPGGFSNRWRGAVARLGQPARRVNYKVLVPALAACLCGVFVVSAVFAGDWGIRNLSSGSNERPQSAEEGGETKPADNFWGIFSPPEENVAPGVSTIESGNTDEQQAVQGSDPQESDLGAATPPQSASITSGMVESQPSAEPGAGSGVSALAEAITKEIELVPGHPVVRAAGNDMRKQIMARVIDLQAGGVVVQLFETEQAVVLEADSAVLAEILLHFGLENVLASGAYPSPTPQADAAQQTPQVTQLEILFE